MTTDSLKEAIKRELPGILRSDPEFRAYILELTRQSYADRTETYESIKEMLADLRRDREDQKAKWDEQNAKWEANQAELKRKWDEQNAKWEANQAELKRMREEQNAKWDEQNAKWEANQAELKLMREEQNAKWEANQAELKLMREEQGARWLVQDSSWEASGKRFDAMHEEIMAQARKHDRSIGALGARWGLQSEKAFRDALASILEQHFDVEVLHVNEFDDSGEVFGRPDQVELDVISKNGLLLIGELKSWIDKAGMYIFERKARFYERRHQRRADRLIVISPMIDPKALKVAERLGIETFGDSEDIKSLSRSE